MGKREEKQEEAEGKAREPRRKKNKEENWNITAAIRRAVIMSMVWRKGRKKMNHNRHQNVTEQRMKIKR